MRPKQHIAVNRLLFDVSSDGKLLLVDRTGGGKTLTMQMALTMSSGIALVIDPLLALTTDQVNKSREQIKNMVLLKHITLPIISYWQL